MTELLGAVDQQLGNPKVGRRGERAVLCPFHPDRHVGSFSYSERGYHCFACGASGGLWRLAEALGLTNQTNVGRYVVPISLGEYTHRAYSPAPPEVSTPVKRYPWQDDGHVLERFWPLADVAIRYCVAHGVAWPAIKRYRLGYGYLPSSRCDHQRLIVPIYEAGSLVAIKGRAIHDDDRDPKWLSAAGSKTALFGADELYPGCRVLVVEAPVSAMAASRWGLVAVAGSSGAATWRDEWTAELGRFRPRSVEVWFDNDGTGLAEGVKLTNRLIEAGLPARRRGWRAGTPDGWDAADVAAVALRSAPVVPPGVVLT